MATKYQRITGLYDATIKQATNDAAQWTAFLRSACRNYKCRFDEQMLIYAQRPDAIAVLEIDKWNKQFGRWVNKGATGIAVFDDEHNGNYRLKHYFDVSDTHGSRFERPVPIWQMEQHFEADVIESLANSFGELEDTTNIANAIISAAKNAVEDNMPDYLRDLMYAREDSFLEELDEFNVEVEYRTVIQNSVSYMMLTRCGLNADEYFGREDFQYITDFNTRNTVNAIGIATSDISEMCLREIATTVINLQKEEQNQNRTFANSENIVQNNININNNINLENNEGSFENDRSVDLSQGGGLFNSQLDSTGGNAGNPWQIRTSEETISQTEPTSAISEPIDGRDAQRAFDGNSADGVEPIGPDKRTDGNSGGLDRGDESNRPDEMGGADEQHTDISGGDNTGRADIQLKPLPTAAQQLTFLGEAEEPAQARTPAFSISQQIIDEVLTTGGNENNSTLRIISYFKKDHTTDKNAVFLQKEYGTGGKGFAFEGNKISVWFKETGIDIAIGDSTLNNHASHITWEQAAKRTRELLDMGRYAPQSELDKADGLELKSLADSFWYTHQDLADNIRFSFIDEDIFRGGFPNSTAKIAELLAQPEQRNIILTGIREFTKEYAENPDLLRFHIAERHLNEVLTGLEDLEREPIIFTANEEISTPRPSFIKQDEIDKLLMGGSGISEGHYRIYSYFLQDHSPKDKTDFLKDEYGTGGFGRTGYNEWHDSKGISFSRENNFMPYDKVILPWPKVAKRIEELIADGTYMSKAQLEYIPEYEKGVLASAIYSFYNNQPEDIARPYPNGSDYYRAKELIIQQLNDPEQVAEILNQMQTILDGTADFDLNYERMEKAYKDLTAFQNGTYSLFKAVKNTNEQKQEQNRPTTYTQEVNEKQVAEPISHIEYDLQLGVTVYIGTTEYEIYSFDDNYVVLRDTNAPLFTREMPRNEFDRKLGENHLNDHLIKMVSNEPQANVADDIDLGDKFYIDQENGKVTWVYFNPDSDAGGQYVYNEVYFDLILETSGITSIESEFFDHLGSMAKQTLVDVGTEEFLEADRYFREEPFDFADCNVATMNALTALANEAFDPQKLVGNRYEIDGRIFVVNSVDVDFNSVSLRDVTFQNKVGFPIFRSETIDFIRMYEPIKPQPEVIPQNTKDNEVIQRDTNKSETSDTADLTPTWEKPKTQRNTQTVDAFPNIPMSERNNFIIRDDDLGAGGAKTKYRYNVEAIRTLQLIESENRLATPTEQEILSCYVGWGGLAEVFDETKSQWANEYVELKSLLTQEEYSSARSTTLNAHYTSPIVIKAIYKAVENMGFKTGNILEPSCGIGNFLGLVPESMKDSKLFGIELDDLTGRIAQQLYQKSSIAIQGYEKTNLPDSFFDLAIGNVPFGGYGVVDKKYDKHKFLIHDFFFAKTLDKVRPGGVIAFITSKGTMDKENPAVRKYIAQRADLLGAIRLPNTAFKSNAGTEVTTDIIFLQKRDRIMDIEPDWVHLGQTEDGIQINSYFVEHPDMMLGTMTNDDGFRMYGNANSTTCVPFPDTDLSELLDDAIQNIHGEFTEYERGDDEPEEDNSIPADPNVRNFSYALNNGQIYYRQDSRMVPVELPVTTQSRVKGMIGLRDCVRTLIEYQTENYPDSDIKAEQAKLNRLYDDFTRKYGLINSRGNNIAFSQDSAYCLLCSLEVIDENGELKRKADMFHKRTIKPHEPVTRVDTASEALALSISEKAMVDLNYMSELTGMNEEALVKELEGVIFLNIGNAESQEKVYVTADEYLSGNVRQKLAQALAAQQTFPDGRYDINVKALEAAQPEDLTAAEISVRLGATWVPPDVIQTFMYELLQTPSWVRNRLKVHYSQHLGEWSVTEKNADRSNIHTFNTYGTQRINAYKIIEESLNLRDVRIFDKLIDADGSEKRVLNKRETAISQAKQELIRSKFEEWIWKDPTRRERLCRIYNDKFNSIKPREYDGSHIKFVGMNPEITLRKHQINAIAHILYGGNTLLAHEVGAGKTYEMVAAAMESKRLGLCSKSLIVVPNHITEQWAAEFLQLYPSANILVATRKDFETKNRKKFCARIATGDYDAVIIGHSQFERIPMSAERQQRMLERQINELLDGLDELKRNRGERYTIKQMERAKKSLEVKLAKLNDQSRKDDVVTFEQLGVNRLFIDESHYYKNRAKRCATSCA